MRNINVLDRIHQVVTELLLIWLCLGMLPSRMERTPLEQDSLLDNTHSNSFLAKPFRKKSEGEMKVFLASIVVCENGNEIQLKYTPSSMRYL